MPATKRETPLATHLPPAKKDISAFVGKDVEFKGIINYNGTVWIDSSLKGEIHAAGNLLVGEGAIITTAKVSAGKEKVKLRSPAVVNGSVKTPWLSIEEGVLFNGTLEMIQPTIREVPRETVLHSIGSSTKAVRNGWARDGLFLSCARFTSTYLLRHRSDSLLIGSSCIAGLVQPVAMPGGM